MKRTLLFLWLLTASIIVVAQTTQPCIVKLYKPKQQKVPLAGVQIEVRDAGTATSDKAGMLTLKFATLKPGDKVTLRRITKAGFEIFNKHAIEQWNVSSDRRLFEIILVKSSYFAQLKNKLYQSSTDNYKKELDNTKNKLAKLLEEGRMKETEYRQQIKELEDQYDNALKSLDNYIDKFARIDLNELSAEEQRILSMVQNGQIDKAVKAYESLNAIDKYVTATTNVSKLDDDITKLEAERTVQMTTADSTFAVLKRQVSTLLLGGGEENFLRAGQLLKRAALADTTKLEAVEEYALFAHKQHIFVDAARFYQICLNGSIDNIPQQAFFHKQLGNVYFRLHQDSIAEEHYLKALDYYTLLFNQDAETYLAGLSSVQKGIGVLYRKLYKNTDIFLHRKEHFRLYEKTKEFLQKALDNYTVLFQKSPDTYRLNMADIQVEQGIWYRIINDNDKAEDYLVKALEHFTLLSKLNPDIYRAYLLSTQLELGQLYKELRNYEKAEDFFIKANDGYTQLYNNNPDAFGDGLIKSQMSLTSLYFELHEFDKAETFCINSLNHLEKLILKNFSYRKNYSYSYRDVYEINRLMLREIFKESKNFTKAETYYFQELQKVKAMYKKQPDMYREDLVYIQHTLVYVYANNNKRELSEKMLNDALTNYEVMYKDDEIYGLGMADLKNTKGKMYLADGRTDDALQLFEEAYKLNPAETQPNLALGYNSKAYIFANASNYDKALETIDRAINLMPKEPKYYDSKGEILLMKGNEQESLKMWHKVLELDPDFLSKHKGGTTFYKQLKAKGLITE